MAASPKIDINLVSLEITSGGKVVSPDVIESVVINKEVNRISSCQLILLDGTPSSQEFPLSDSNQFLPGEELAVKAGYDNESLQVIFKGIVTKMGLNIDPDLGPSMEVTCKDKAIKMTVGRKNAYYYKKTDKKIISDVIGQHSGVSADVAATEGELPEVLQYYATDWDFVLSRADFNGMIVTTDGGKVTVTSPDKVTEEALQVTYGTDIIAFQAEMDSMTQYKKVKASAWNIKDQKLINGEATISNSKQGNVASSKLAEVSGLKNYELQSTVPMMKGGLGDWAKAQTAKSKYAKIRGTVTFQGTEKAEPAKLLSINGMGERFNGSALISGVTHEIAAGNWTSTITIGLNANWFTERVDVQAPLASGVLPGIQGLQNGKIKKIDEDPDGELRVQVDIPVANPSSKGVWARYASFYASKEVGAFFYPQVGDEVVLGFFNNDPSYPVVLGSLYSSAIKAPYKPDKDNSKQGIVTKNKLVLEFDDKDKILTLTTPDKRQVVLNDKDKNISIITADKNQLILSDKDKKVTLKDQNDNSIEMSSSGIVVESAKALTLKAKQDIKIEAGAGLTISAKQGLSAKAGTSLDLKGSSGLTQKAPKISISADAQAELKAGASMDVKGGANLKMKAAMIMIN